MNDQFGSLLGAAKTVAIAGHTRPDGDCVGSCLGLYNYLRDNYPALAVDVYLEPVADVYGILENCSVICSTYDCEKQYDLFICLDCGDRARLAGAGKYFDTARRTLNIDHHISNQGYGDENVVFADASSTCEVLAGMMDFEKLGKGTAEALYVGMICDTGCFKHSNTTEKTMNIAGRLISKGIAFSKLTDEVFYQRTYMQNQLLGRCLVESFLVFNGRCIISVVDQKTLAFYGADSKDLEGVIDQMRITKGVETAVLLTETGALRYKVSMRSNEYTDVNRVAAVFGGGGHIRAAGCTVTGTKHDVITNLLGHIWEQMKDHD